MTPSIFSVWCVLGVALFNERVALKFDTFVGRKRKKVWRAAPLCLFWTVWKEMNNRVFDNKELSDKGIKLVFLCNLWAWSKLFIVLDFSSIVDFVDWIGAL